jgi:hydrogenase maturation protease
MTPVFPAPPTFWTSSLSKKAAVVGLGNTLRRDDGIGIVVLEALLNFYQRQDLDYLNFGIAGFDLLHRLSDYPKALLIDAIDAGLPVGEVRICALGDLTYSAHNLAVSTHELDLKSLFELSKRLKIKTALYVAGIQAQDISFGEGLSPALEKRKSQIIQEIDTFIRNNF